MWRLGFSRHQLSKQRTLAAGALCLVGAATGCDKGDDTGDGDATEESSSDETSTETTGGDDGEFWAVGGDSEMLRVGLDTLDDGYVLDLAGEPDLNAIACRGVDEAWVVGAGGVALRTQDAGSSWELTSTGITSDLRGVTAALAATVWAAGDGAVLRSTDDGMSWEVHPAAQAASYTAISVEELGLLAFVGDDSGGLWRMTPDDADLRVQHPHALRDVQVSSHGEHVIAVGDAGSVLISHDGGEVFSPIETGLSPAPDLLAVTLSSNGRYGVIAGEAGILLRLADDVLVPMQLNLDLGAETAPDLHDVHADSSGGIQVVGDRGIILMSEDDGASWSMRSSPRGRDLFGIDSVDGRGHH